MKSNVLIEFMVNRSILSENFKMALSSPLSRHRVPSCPRCGANNLHRHHLTGTHPSSIIFLLFIF